MDEPKYIIKTTMEKEDYRKFLYWATFRKNIMFIPMLAILALAGSLLLKRELSSLNWITVAIYWLFLFALAIAVVCFKVERKYRLRINSDKTGTFSSPNVLKFYEDKVIMENDFLKSTGELKYSQFFYVRESNDYIIFYLTTNQASLIRKKDVDSLDTFKQFLMKVFIDKYKRI